MRRMTVIAFTSLMLISSAPSLAGEAANLAAGARVCDATDCFVLAATVVPVRIYQGMPDGSVQFHWHNGLLTAKPDTLDRQVQDCAWGQQKGQRTYLCDGVATAPREADAPYPKRRIVRDAALEAALKRYGVADARTPN